MNTPTSTMSDSVRVPRSALAWLFGEESDEAGRWFEKEKFPEASGAYWWRSVFRNKIKKAAAAPAPAADVTTLPGYPFLPCPICKGVEGCDHTVPERARAADVREAVLVEAQEVSEAFRHEAKSPAELVRQREALKRLRAALASRPAMDEARLRDLHEIANWLRGQFIAFDHDLPARREWVEKIHRAADALAAMRAATGVGQ